MASVSRYQTTRGETRWRCRYRTPSGKQTDKRGFKSKPDAERWANTVEVAKLKREYIQPSLGRITLGELSSAWLHRKSKHTAPSHYRMLESAWRVHVAPRWANVAVADLDVLDVEEWVAGIAGGATTVQRAYGVLSGILSDAVKAKRLAVNPAKGVENLPRRSTRRHVYLSADDVHRLAEESGQHRALVLTLAYCGVRWGELVALQSRDIEFLRRRISVHANAVQLGVDHAVGPTKGRTSRTVPVPQFVLDALSVQCRGKAPDDLVFGDGEHYLPRPKSHGGWFAAAVQRAKVQAITPHDLRHTCASLAISAGVNVLALQRMLGHTSAKVTLDTYADLFDTDLDDVAISLNSRYSPTSVGSLWAKAGSTPSQQT